MANLEMPFPELEGLSEKERECALQILKEFSVKGKSEKYSNLLYADYNEVPVDIETFLHDKRYLGNALYNAEGKFTLFPYWEEKLKEIFPTNTTTAYNTIVFTGAIGLGKSTIAVICLLYMLYRLLCLKDPYLFYGLQPADKITISLLNITIENAKGVAQDKMNQMILSSQWFLSHGKMAGKTNLVYEPEKHIELITASSNNQVIGRAVYCLDGETVIKTTSGDMKLQDMVGKSVQVMSLDNDMNTVISNECQVMPTITTDEEYQVEMDDGTVIKCTGNHRFLLKDGSYKEARFLTEDDELYDVYQYSYDEYIQHIIGTRGQWNIPSDEYCEVHHIIPRCMGGEGVIRKRRPHPNLIFLYAHEHFIAHKLLYKEHPENKQLLYAWSMMAFPKSRGQKLHRGVGISEWEYEELRVAQSNLMRERLLENTKKPWNFGLTKETSESMKAISDKLRGKNTWSRGTTRSESAKKRISEASRKRYEEHPETFASKTKGKICVTNGQEIRYIDKDDPVPDGFHRGQHKHKPHIIKDPVLYSSVRSLASSGDKNPMYGNGEKVSGGKNGHAIYVYSFEGVEYQSRDELMVVLKDRYPTISESTIRRIQSNNYTEILSKKYQYVIDHLSWRLKER